MRRTREIYGHLAALNRDVGGACIEAGGVGQRVDLYAGYEEESGLTIDDEAVRYWEVMAHLNWAIIALQQARRHVGGQERSLLLALTGHIVPELEWALLDMTGED